MYLNNSTVQLNRVRGDLEDVYITALFDYHRQEDFSMKSKSAETAAAEGLDLEKILSMSWWPERVR